MTKSTPEGSRDYVVPSRLYNGKFYALPQSPQQYKQLLMASGVDRYFQIARCFRDEDTRGDRQPEFTQIDIEMSFVEQEDVMAVNEKMVTELVKKLYPEKKIQQTPFPRLSYKEAMEKYGSDKPDLRKDKDLMDGTNTGGIVAAQYDMVLNGCEAGGGGIRNHDPKALIKVFETMGYPMERIEANFGHMLKALASGTPPHGGLAFGFDRLIMLLQNEPNIREIIAFAKTGEGRDPMMDSPAEIETKQLRELGIKFGK